MPAYLPNATQPPSQWPSSELLLIPFISKWTAFAQIWPAKPRWYELPLEFSRGRRAHQEV